MREDQVNKIKEKFVKDYMMKEPYSGYINAVGISDVGLMEWVLGGRQGNPTTTNELCLYVGLRKPLPDSMVLPQVYESLKVYVDPVVGEIRPAS